MTLSDLERLCPAAIGVTVTLPDDVVRQLITVARKAEWVRDYLDSVLSSEDASTTHIAETLAPMAADKLRQALAVFGSAQ